VSEEGFVVGGSAASTPRRLSKRDGRYDLGSLLAVLKEVKKVFPAKRDIQVAAEDSVQYEHLVQTMDTALVADFPDVSVTDIAAAQL